MRRRHAGRLLGVGRRQRQAWARLQRERQRLAPELALAEERGLLGALILEPAMIAVMAPMRPPAWFTDAKCLVVMRALFCIQRLHSMEVRDVADALDCHDALEFVGGVAAIAALVEPSAHLTEARVVVAAFRPPPVHEMPLVVFAARLLDAELVAAHLTAVGSPD